MDPEDTQIPPRHLSPLSHHFEPEEEHVHTELKQKSEHLLSFLLYAAKNPNDHSESLKMLTKIQCMADYRCLAPEEEQKAVQEIDELKSDIHSASSTLKDMEKRLEGIILHIQDTNPKAKLLCLVVDFDYHLHISPPDELPPMEHSQWDGLFKTIFDKINDPQSTPFQINGISKNLSEIQEKFLQDPRGNHETTIKEIELLNQEIQKKSF